MAKVVGQRVEVIRQGNPERVTSGVIVSTYHNGDVVIDEDGFKFRARFTPMYRQLSYMEESAIASRAELCSQSNSSQNHPTQTGASK